MVYTDIKDKELRKQTVKFITKPFTKKINIAITELQVPDFGLVPKERGWVKHVLRRIT